MPRFEIHGHFWHTMGQPRSRLYINQGHQTGSTHCLGTIDWRSHLVTRSVDVSTTRSVCPAVCGRTTLWGWVVVRSEICFGSIEGMYIVSVVHQIH